jgi:hypothetical protein
MNESRANERVKIATSRGDILLPWETRQELLRQIRGLESARSTIDAFEAVGTSRRVTLETDEKGLLVDAINLWAGNVAVDGLPEGAWDLRCALIDELHDTAGGP